MITKDIFSTNNLETFYLFYKYITILYQGVIF